MRTKLEQEETSPQKQTQPFHNPFTRPGGVMPHRPAGLPR